MKKILIAIALLMVVGGTVMGTSMHSKWVNGNNLVYYDTYEYRWLDAIGPDVVKYVDHFAIVPVGADNADPAGWTLTALVGAAGRGTFTGGATYGGELVVRCDTTENDGLNVLMAGEAFKLASNKPCYFGVKLKVSDADQTDLLIGLCITDTELWGGMTDGVYFASADATAVCSFTTEKDSTPTADTSAGTLVDDTYSILEFYWDGSKYIHAYFDGVLVASSSTNLPDDEALTLALEFLTGENTTQNEVAIDWLRIIQVN